MAHSDVAPVDLRHWLAKPGLPSAPLDGAAHKVMVDMLLWELAQLGGPEHNVERFSALLKATAILLGALTLSEDDEFVKDAALSIGVEVYNEMMSFRDAAAREGKTVGPHHG